MLTAMVIVFLVGYLMIILEHPLKINKVGMALLIDTVLWAMYTHAAPFLIPRASAEEFSLFLESLPSLGSLTLKEQYIRFVMEHQVLDSIGEIAETLIFLTGAIITVEPIDARGNFMPITNHIATKKEKELLALIAMITFFMSAVSDNLTTLIVMIILTRKLLGNYKERWVFGSITIIAANSGGVWSPTDDVITIMLQVRGNISTSSMIPHLILPNIVSALIPASIAMRFLHGSVTPPSAFLQTEADNELPKKLKDKEKLLISIIGVLCLLFVSVFKMVTHPPPFIGILMGMGTLRFYTEMLYACKPINENLKLHLSKVAHRIDGATLLFFLGILSAVDALHRSGVLSDFVFWLDGTVGSVYAVSLTIGILSSIVDNVPLVAGVIGTYPVATDIMVAATTDPAYLANSVQGGVLWQFLVYCAGVGGSMLITGSVVGIVVMGLERINFIWYLKNIPLLALAGYLSGVVVCILQNLILQ